MTSVFFFHFNAMTCVYLFTTVVRNFCIYFRGLSFWNVTKKMIWRSNWSGCFVTINWFVKPLNRNCFFTTLGIFVILWKWPFLFFSSCFEIRVLKKIENVMFDGDVYDLNVFLILNIHFKHIDQRTERKSGCQTIYLIICRGVLVIIIKYITVSSYLAKLYLFFHRKTAFRYSAFAKSRIKRNTHTKYTNN